MSLMDDLQKLFRIDSQVRGLESRVKSAERYLKGQQTKLDTLADDLAELATRERHLKAEIANAESEMAAFDERIEKLREELNSSETNKQYTALLTEINTIKASRSEIETMAIATMQKVDAVAEEIKAIRDLHAERKKHRDQAAADLEERKSDVGDRLSELQRERTGAAEKIPADALESFNVLADQYDGEAMAPVEVIDRRNREYACKACNMHLPFETVSVLMGMGTSLTTCTNCQRILYMQEETKGVIAGKK